MTTTRIRHGFVAVRPYLYGALDVAEFVEHVLAPWISSAAFGPKAFHIESDGRLGRRPRSERPAARVEDDRVRLRVRGRCGWRLPRAMEIGARSVAEPEDKPYKERSAGVQDSFGNTWRMSTCKP